MKSRHDGIPTSYYRIAQVEGFPDMQLELSRAGNMAWIKGKKIKANKIQLGDYLSPAERDAMFLHELAHFIRHRAASSGKRYAQVGKGENHHDASYADTLTYLMGKYCVLLHKMML
jgi:predicted SprT family Zn-dependent metalloprotease